MNSSPSPGAREAQVIHLPTATPVPVSQHPRGRLPSSVPSISPNSRLRDRLTRPARQQPVPQHMPPAEQLQQMAQHAGTSVEFARGAVAVSHLTLQRIDALEKLATQLLAEVCSVREFLS